MGRAGVQAYTGEGVTNGSFPFIFMSFAVEF